MVFIKAIWFEDDNIFVKMNDGQTICKPINLYKNLSRGTKQQLANYKIEGNGRWVYWEELDEDLSADGFLQTQNQL